MGWSASSLIVKSRAFSFRFTLNSGTVARPTRLNEIPEGGVALMTKAVAQMNAPTATIVARSHRDPGRGSCFDDEGCRTNECADRHNCCDVNELHIFRHANSGHTFLLNANLAADGPSKVSAPSLACPQESPRPRAGASCKRRQSYGCHVMRRNLRCWHPWHRIQPHVSTCQRRRKRAV